MFWNSRSGSFQKTIRCPSSLKRRSRAVVDLVQVAHWRHSRSLPIDGRARLPVVHANQVMLRHECSAIRAYRSNGSHRCLCTEQALRRSGVRHGLLGIGRLDASLSAAWRSHRASVVGELDCMRSGSSLERSSDTSARAPGWPVACSRSRRRCRDHHTGASLHQWAYNRKQLQGPLRSGGGSSFGCRCHPVGPGRRPCHGHLRA